MKYFKKQYDGRYGLAIWGKGDAINYNGENITEITKTEYDTLKIPLEQKREKEVIKQKLIQVKMKELAIESLRVDGKLDSNGDVI